jgi:hypothetical protein
VRGTYGAFGVQSKTAVSDLLSNSAFDPNRIIPRAVVLCAGEVFDRDMGPRVAMGTGTLEVAAYDDEIERRGIRHRHTLRDHL